MSFRRLAASLSRTLRPTSSAAFSSLCFGLWEASGHVPIWERQVVSPTANVIEMATTATMDTNRFRIQRFVRRRWLPREWCQWCQQTNRSNSEENRVWTPFGLQ
jgi:hypothetical protein